MRNKFSMVVSWRGPIPKKNSKKKAVVKHKSTQKLLIVMDFYVAKWFYLLFVVNIFKFVFNLREYGNEKCMRMG